jgi:hypothetical protein
MKIQIRKSKTLTVIAFILIANSAYGLTENSNHISLKNESSTREVVATDSIKFIDKSDKQKQSSNTINNLESTRKLSSEVGVGVFSEGGLNIYLTSWRQIKPWFSFGMGLGLRHYFSQEITMVPIFIDLKANLTTKKISPFLSCKLGYSLGGRLLLNPKIGLSLKRSNKNALNIGIGYDIQQIGTFYYVRGTDKSISANIGFQF